MASGSNTREEEGRGAVRWVPAVGGRESGPDRQWEKREGREGKWAARVVLGRGGREEKLGSSGGKSRGTGFGLKEKEGGRGAGWAEI